jgi:hypothetical protein
MLHMEVNSVFLLISFLTCIRVWIHHLVHCCMQFCTRCISPMGTNPSCPIRSMTARAYDCPCPMFHDGGGSHVGTTRTSSVCWIGQGSCSWQSSRALPATVGTDRAILNIAGKTTRLPKPADCQVALPHTSHLPLPSVLLPLFLPSLDVVQS